MQCPACHYEPTMSEHVAHPESCSKCGVYYAKFKARQKELEQTNSSSGMVVPPYIRESLSQGEEVQVIFKLHWFAWVKVWLWGFFGVLTILLLPVAVYVWLSLRTVEQGVTNKRVIVKRGIISRKTEEMKLGSIETVELNQSVLGRIFGYGDVKVTGRGISDVLFKCIDDPLTVKRQIESISHPIS
jgi:hypothetical protein